MDDEVSVDALADAVRNMHGVEPRFVSVEHVKETFNGEVVWEGEVHAFDLVGHPKAARAYAWSHATTGTKRRFFAVLGVPPIDSAVAAVRASIVADERAKRS